MWRKNRKSSLTYSYSRVVNRYQYIARYAEGLLRMCQAHFGSFAHRKWSRSTTRFTVLGLLPLSLNLSNVTSLPTCLHRSALECLH